jgi:PEP-CTERM motif
VGFVAGKGGASTSNTFLDETNSVSVPTTTAFPTSLIPSGNFIGMCVSSDGSCQTTDAAIFAGMTTFADPIPEPASLGLLGGAVTAIGLIRRRRARKVAKG